MVIFYEPWVQIRILLDLPFLLKEVLCKYLNKKILFIILTHAKDLTIHICISNSDEHV